MAPPQLTSVRAEQIGRVLAGLVRSEGIIVPIAEFSGGRWVSDTAGAGRTPGITPPVWFTRAGPSPREWSVVLESGTRRNVTASTATLVQSHCSPQWGLLGDLGDQTPADARRRQVGIAAAGAGVGLDGFSTLDRSSPEMGKLVAAVTADFNRDEDGSFDRWTASGLATGVATRDDRHAIPIVVEAAYRSRGLVNGQTLLMVTVTRTHRESINGPCTRISVLDTWVVADSLGRFTPLEGGRYALSECRRTAVPTRVPFGIIRVAGLSFVVTGEYVGETEEYRISTIATDAVRTAAVTFGGGCEG